MSLKLLWAHWHHGSPLKTICLSTLCNDIRLDLPGRANPSPGVIYRTSLLPFFYLHILRLRPFKDRHCYLEFRPTVLFVRCNGLDPYHCHSSYSGSTSTMDLNFRPSATPPFVTTYDMPSLKAQTASSFSSTKHQLYSFSTFTYSYSYSSILLILCYSNFPSARRRSLPSNSVQFYFCRL